ncbi:MAG: hypothetical protein Q8P27_01365 [Candidatus Peregrinibacteria bacterium]|nr:hypothetical protein [Candidatus Peregrinibacteria bacterium]
MKDFHKFLEQLFDKEAKELLKIHHVSTEKYVAWSADRFRKQSFYAGLD